MYLLSLKINIKIKVCQFLNFVNCGQSNILLSPLSSKQQRVGGSLCWWIDGYILAFKLHYQSVSVGLSLCVGVLIL